MKTYIVTGASRGIGLELTKQILEMGHGVQAWVRNPDASSGSNGLQALASKYPAAFRAVRVDVTNQASVDGAAREFGTGALDGLINNAGVYLDEGADLARLAPEVLTRTFETNSVAPLRVTQALLPALRLSREPRVAHITSLMGSIEDNSSGGSYAYRMSKTALNMFEKCFAIDHPEIISMVLHPGWVKTEMGGRGAPVEPADSARGLLKVFFSLSKKDSGAFRDYEGDSLPW
jgi:NAD(P)-dependent dehydrogenase (short-subunit alcohol dehydrogenase family)